MMTAVCAFSLPFHPLGNIPAPFRNPNPREFCFYGNNGSYGTTKSSLYPNDPVPNNNNTNTTSTLSPIHMLAQSRINPTATCQPVCGPSQYTASEGHLQRSK
jgi:hypothetical protein